MTLFYNEPKDGSKFATFFCQDWNTINSKLEFDELRFTSDDDFYYVYCYARSLTDCTKIGDKDFKFASQLLTFEVARKTVQKWSKADSKKVDTPQSLVERLVCTILDKAESDKAYSGFLVLQHNEFIRSVLDGKDASGNPIPDVVAQQILSTSYQLTEVETDLVPVDDVKVKAKKSWSGGSKGQTEKEKLGDRLCFIAEQMKLAGIETEVKSVADLAVLFEGEKTPATIYQICCELMK